MKPLTLLLSCLIASVCFSQSLNMTLEANWDGIVQDYNDCWGYNAPNGTEVAILGSLQRVYFFDVSDPTNPEVIDYFVVLNENGTTNTSIWRDFKTYDHYAYASADQGTSGLLIFDLQYVPDSVVLVAQNRDFWVRTHNIWIDVDHGRLYAAGSNTVNLGLIVLDLEADPEDPPLIGNPVLPLGYVHDVHVVDNIAYASHGSDQALTIYDFANADNPVVIRTLEDYPEPGYNHSSWLDATGNRLVFADETHGMGLKCVNPNITEHQTTNYHIFRSNTGSIAHNPFIKGDLCYVAYYHDGVQVFDISDTNNIERVAYYDTYSPGGYAGYEGCWGVYPYLESGIILASDITYGLFVLTLEEDLLPLEVVSFDANKINKDVRLTWKVTAQEEGQLFYVEHSMDGVIFSQLDWFVADLNTLNYEYVHEDPGPGDHYYRIVVRHPDGREDPTAVRPVYFDMEDVLLINPTTVYDVLEIDTGRKGRITLISYDGREILSTEADALERTELQLGFLAAGLYYVVFQTGEEVYVEPFTRLWE